MSSGGDIGSSQDASFGASGDGFSAKDFRTWGGTLCAALELERHGALEGERQARRALANVMRKVGEELGNTPAVARDSYVSPLVVAAYLDGRTLTDFRRGGRGPRRGLDADERALLGLLRAQARSAGSGWGRPSRASRPG